MAEKQTLRLFLGSFVELEGINAEFEHSVRFVKPENLHLTWKFFGDTSKKYLSKILTKIENVISKTGELSINFNRFELWPTPRYPRMLVLAGDDVNGNATELYRAFNKDEFRPHITVARFQLKQKPARPIELPKNLIFSEKVFNFLEISLLSSKLTLQGSIYEAVKTFKI